MNNFFTDLFFNTLKFGLKTIQLTSPETFENSVWHDEMPKEKVKRNLMKELNELIAEDELNYPND